MLLLLWGNLSQGSPNEAVRVLSSAMTEYLGGTYGQTNLYSIVFFVVILVEIVGSTKAHASPNRERYQPEWASVV